MWDGAASRPPFFARQVFKDYFKELEEESIRDNFVITYELMDEMMDFGYPQISEPKILREYITQVRPRRPRCGPGSQPRSPPSLAAVATLAPLPPARRPPGPCRRRTSCRWRSCRWR